MQTHKAPVRPTPRRGRPLKFGRPAQLVTLTLPDDVVAWLKGVHPDPAWAVVKLFERARHRQAHQAAERAPAELVQLPGRRALIVVRPELFQNLPGIQLIPLQDGRAFLAFDPGRGIADLEIAVLDRLEGSVPPPEREGLTAVHTTLKRWRQQGLHFRISSIIIAERRPSSDEQPLPLTDLGRETGQDGVA